MGIKTARPRSTDSGVWEEAPDGIQTALHALRRGGVVAYPTEGCYGLGCDPRNVGAVNRILRLKRRARCHGLILIGAYWRHLAPWVDASEVDAIRRARESWPGPYTWLLPARSGVSPWLRGDHDSIAARLTAHPIAAALCRRFDSAIVSTSANLRGGRPALNSAQAHRLFGGRVDALLEGPLGGLRGPTEIRDARTGELIRAG